MEKSDSRPAQGQAMQTVEAPDSRPVTLSWLRDGRIAVFKITGPATRSTVDQWFETVSSVVKSWPPDKLYLAMQDLSDKEVSLTPYASKRAREFEPLVKHLRGRVALVLPNTFANQIFRLFLRTLSWQQSMPTEAFVTYDAALRWLDATLNNQDKPKPTMRYPWRRV